MCFEKRQPGRDKEIEFWKTQKAQEKAKWKVRI